MAISGLRGATRTERIAAFPLFCHSALGPTLTQLELDWSLGILARRLADVGRREEALAPSQETADRFHALAEADPDTYLPFPGRSLNTLAGRFAA
jgi:hypothetical protein